MTSWANWQHPVLPLQVTGDAVTIGVRILCGAKSRGTPDDFSLVRVE